MLLQRSLVAETGKLARIGELLKDSQTVGEVVRLLENNRRVIFIMLLRMIKGASESMISLGH